jgi:hypothetical protein
LVCKVLMFCWLPRELCREWFAAHCYTWPPDFEPREAASTASAPDATGLDHEPPDPGMIARSVRRGDGDDIDAAAAVLFQHRKIKRRDLALAVPSGRTKVALPKSQEERGRLLRKGVKERYPNFPADYSDT